MSETTETGERRPGEVIQAGETRLATIESLRALGALAVFGGHCYMLAIQFDLQRLTSAPGILASQGQIGLILFFSLSGYLFYWPFARRIFIGDGRIKLGQYAVNRALRMLPLYFIAVTILLIWLEDGGTLELWARYLTFTTNFDPRTLTIDPPLWTVPVELHFYILLPLIAVGLGAISRGRLSVAAAVLIALGAASFWVRETQIDSVYADALTKSLPSRFCGFVPGMLIALIRVHWTEHPPTWLRGWWRRSDLWFAAAVALLAMNAVNWQYSIINTGLPEELLAVGLIIGAVALPALQPGLVSRILTWRPLAALGLISYSFYVWHRVVLVEVAGRTQWDPPLLAAISLPIVIAVSFVSYKLFEEPFLRFRRGWGGGVDRKLDKVSTAPVPATGKPAAQDAAG